LYATVFNQLVPKLLQLPKSNIKMQKKEDHRFKTRNHEQYQKSNLPAGRQVSKCKKKGN